MATIDILEALEQEFPIKRQVNVEGWPVPIWVWRLDAEQIVEMQELPRETAAEKMDFCRRLVGMGIGNEEKPGAFDSDRGREWLKRHPNVQLELMHIVQDFNEMNGPSEDREKKSEPSADSSTSVET